MARNSPHWSLTPTSRRRPARTAAATALLAAIGATTVGCTSNSPAPAPSPAALPACHSPQAPVLPHTAGSLTQTDTGAYCLGLGQTLDVFLTAPAPAAGAARTRWSQVTIGDAAVLTHGNDGVMTPPVNVTPGVVIGRTRGTSTLTSTLPDGRRWTATIVVS